MFDNQTALEMILDIKYQQRNTVEVTLCFRVDFLGKASVQLLTLKAICTLLYIEIYYQKDIYLMLIKICYEDGFFS